jgi:pimeloyl-ACP methyl ester carboxylesterase
MRPDELRDASRLAAMTIRAGVSRIHELHGGIARRAFDTVGPAAVPVRVVHDAIAGAVYGGVRGALGAGVRVAGHGASRRAGGRSLDDVPAARVALAIVNGSHGDLLERVAPALAVRMAVRERGRDVPLDADSLRSVYADATDRVVVFLHGLTETEGAWCWKSVRHHGRPDVTYGSLLRRDLGYTPVFVRYNTGLHISDNGARLDDLLQRLVDGWPVPTRDLVLVGHSMGGLVARSALHHAGSGTTQAMAWTALVRDTITLGSPHLGAPLERGAHRVTHLLNRLPETRPVARVLASRSVGIKDLRHGTLVADDWDGRDLDALERLPRTHVPLHDGARHFVVLATLTRSADARSARVLGDLLVPPLSATGDTGDDHRLAFPADHVHRIGRRHHFDLLNDPEVYERIRGWLAERPPLPA